MSTEIKIERKVKDPKFLVITPLLPSHEISKETKKTIKRNDIPFDWIKGIGNNNIPTNTKNSINLYKKQYGYIKFYIMLDNDIILSRHMLDKMYETIKNTPEYIAYTYTNFEFKGEINAKFPAIPFDAIRLLQSNYISSNSMFKTNIVEEIGLVTDDKYKRLLDWAFLLKLLVKGYIGIPTRNASFIAISNEGSISSGSQNDYIIKSQRVKEDFILPFIKKGH